MAWVLRRFQYTISDMDSVTFENYRCFRERQTVRLAPLTLLVGENSTGKTSFLALIRALWDMAYDSRIPDFREEPWDLGSYDEIAHHRGSRGGRASAFKVGFRLPRNRGPRGSSNEFTFSLVNDRMSPAPIELTRARGETWISEQVPPLAPYSLTVGTPRGQWRLTTPADFGYGREGFVVSPARFVFSKVGRFGASEFDPLDGAPPLDQDDFEKLRRLTVGPSRARTRRPFASAPVRSEPLRTYDPSRIFPDPEGDYIPMYLADVQARDPDTWQYLKERLEAFGGPAGLFDEIEVRHFGGHGSPFQIRVKKHGGRLIGPWRNIVDVGYGVSQALPVITEIFRRDASEMALLQQPEVHLHPMAQAALGSLLCQIASESGSRRRLIVETHSYDLINRVRMDVRDGVNEISPDDVVVLYFERDGLDVKIHEITFDELGNLNGAPSSYGRFFMEETSRNIWPEKYADVR